MMKMATGEGLPPLEGCRNGSRLVFGGYGGLWGRNSRSIVFLDCFRQKKYVRGATRGPRGWRARLGGRPCSPVSWPPRKLLDLHSKFFGSCSFQKSRSRRFHSVWTTFDIPFLRNTEIGKKTAIWVGPPVSRLVPKMI